MTGVISSSFPVHTAKSGPQADRICVIFVMSEALEGGYFESFYQKYRVILGERCPD